MTCNCNDTLAAIRQAAIDTAILCRGMDNKAGSDAFDFFAGRLSPPPSAPVPELAGWRAKCRVDRTGHGWFVYLEGYGHLWQSGTWNRTCWESEAQNGYFPTRAAAVAALNAASPPPGCVEDRPVWTATGRTCLNCGHLLSQHEEQRYCPPTGTANTRPYAAVVADGKTPQPVPAEGFDATAIAKSLSQNGVGDGFVYQPVKIVARSIDAAHQHGYSLGYAAGAASAKPRLRYEVLNAKKEAVAAFRDHYTATLFCGGTNGWSVVDTQPAAPADAKEAAQ